MTTTPARRWLSSALVALALLVAAFAGATRAAAEDAVFVTGIEVQGQAWAPTQTKIAYAWSDKGFAVHVPIDVETYLTSSLDAAGAKREEWTAHSYRVELSVSGLRFTDPTAGEVHAQLNAVAWGAYGAAGPVECVLNASGLAYAGVTDTDKDPSAAPWHLDVYFRDMRKRGARAVWILLAPSQIRAQTTRFGFTERAWTMWGESVTPTIRVAVLRKPAGGQPEKRIRGTALPVKIRQDGWVLRSANSELGGDWGAVVHKSDGREWSLEDLGAELRGATLVTRHRRSGRPVKAGIGRETSDYELTYTFPQRAWDHGPFDVTCRIAQTAGFVGVYGAWTFLREGGWKLSPYPQGITTAGGTGASGRIQTSYAVEDPATKFLSKQTETHHIHFRWSSIQGAEFGGIDVRQIGAHVLFVVNEKYKTEIHTSGQKPPTRRVEVVAMRMSEVEDNRIGNLTPPPDDTGPMPEPPDDGYPAWIPGFAEKRDRALADLQAAHAVLATLRAHHRDERDQALERMRLLAQGQLVDDPEEEDFILVARRYLAGDAPPMAGVMLPAQQEQLRREIRAHQDELTRIRAEQAAIVAETMAALADVAADVQRQSERSGDRRPYVGLAERMWTDQLDLEEIRLFDSAGMRREMRAAIERVRTSFEDGRQDPAVRAVLLVLDGKAREAEGESFDEQVETMLAQGQPVSEPLAMCGQRLRMLALFAYKDALKLVPDDAHATQAVQQLELVFLHRIYMKVEREKQVVWENFRAYMEERGFSMEDPDGATEIAWEYVKAFFGGGPIGPAYLYENKAEAQAEHMEADRDTAVRDLISLRAVSRLRASGMTLADIRQIRWEDVRESIVGRAGNRLGEPAARRIAQDIHTTFADLPELAALADGDEDRFREQLVTPHFPLGFESTWPEFGADFFNAINIGSFFLGGAITKIDGKWAGVITRGVLGQRVAQGARVDTVSQVVIRGVMNSRVGARLAGSPTVRWMAARMARDREWLDDLPTLERWLRKGGSFMGVIAVFGGIHVAADANDVPALAMFTDAILILGGGQYLRGVLDDIALGPAKALEKVKLYQQILTAERAAIERRLDDIVVLQRIAEQQEAAAAAHVPGRPRPPLTAEQKAAVERIRAKYGVDPDDPIPGLDPNNELDRLVVDAADAVTGGNPKTAAAHAAAAKKIGDTRVAHINEAIFDTKEALTALQKAYQAAAKLEVSNPFKGGDPKLNDVPLPAPWMPAKGYPEGAFGAAWQRGDELFSKGLLDEALGAYQKARALGLRGAPPGYIRLLDRRMGTVVSIQGAKRFLGDTRKVLNAIRANVTINDEEMLALQGRIDRGELQVKIAADKGTATIYEISENGKAVYVFKMLRTKIEILDPHVLNELANEELGALLANVAGLGMRGPAARKLALRFTVVQSGIDSQGTGVLMRYVPGIELIEQKESMALALKSEYAKHRVLSLLLGDPDRHLKNYLLGGDHELWAIDFGNAHLFRDVTRAHPLAPQTMFRSEQEFMDWCVDFSTIVQKFMAVHGKVEAKAIYNWARHMEGVIDYETDMKPVVLALQKLVKEDRGSRLRWMIERSCQKLDDQGNRILGKDGLPEVDMNRVDEIMEVLQKRVDLLEPVLQKKFPVWSQRAPEVGYAPSVRPLSFARAA